MSRFDRLVEEKIKKAMEEGAFDDLPGAGRPLRLDENLHEEPEMRMAHHLLKTHGFAPAWIEERREIELAVSGARQGLVRSWEWAQSREDGWSRSEWGRAVEAFRRQIEQLNKRIANYNLIAPTPAAQRPALDAERELRRITGAAGEN